MQRITQKQLSKARGVDFTRLMRAYARQVEGDILAGRAAKNRTGGWSVKA